MDIPNQMRLAQSRLEQARAEADEYARIADILSNNLAAALNKLKPFDPAFVAQLSGEEYTGEVEESEPLSPPEEAPVG